MENDDAATNTSTLFWLPLCIYTSHIKQHFHFIDIRSSQRISGNSLLFTVKKHFPPKWIHVAWCFWISNSNPHKNVTLCTKHIIKFPFHSSYMYSCSNLLKYRHIFFLLQGDFLTHFMNLAILLNGFISGECDCPIWRVSASQGVTSQKHTPILFYINSYKIALIADFLGLFKSLPWYKICCIAGFKICWHRPEAAWNSCSLVSFSRKCLLDQYCCNKTWELTSNWLLGSHLFEAC